MRSDPGGGVPDRPHPNPQAVLEDLVVADNQDAYVRLDK